MIDINIIFIDLPTSKTKTRLVNVFGLIKERSSVELHDLGTKIRRIFNLNLLQPTCIIIS